MDTHSGLDETSKIFGLIACCVTSQCCVDVTVCRHRTNTFNFIEEIGRFLHLHSHQHSAFPFDTRRP